MVGSPTGVRKQGLDSGKEKTRDDMSKTVVKPWGKGPGESSHAMLNKHLNSSSGQCIAMES